MFDQDTVLVPNQISILSLFLLPSLVYPNNKTTFSCLFEACFAMFSDETCLEKAKRKEGERERERERERSDIQKKKLSKIENNKNLY